MSPIPDAAGRTVLVTGSSRGLGRETCRELARRGFHVIATSRDPDQARDLAEELTGRGGAAEHHGLDVEDADSIAALAAHLRGRSVDVLVNNAAIALDGFDAEVARRTIAINFTGALAVTDAILPLMPRGAGIVMVSSGVGGLSDLGPEARARLADRGLTRDALIALMQRFVADVQAGRHRAEGWPSSAYQVSKAGLNALVRVLAPELSGRGIGINAVCPGWVRTDMGGSHAPRGLAEGAASIVWAAALTDGTTGGFFRDGAAIPW
jgi:carbonyl reductase 1